jgi:hypothetical protein
MLYWLKLTEAVNVLFTAKKQGCNVFSAPKKRFIKYGKKVDGIYHHLVCRGRISPTYKYRYV